jgi:hypothetical protein
MAKDAFDSYEHLYTQFAILDSAYNQIQNQYEGLKEQHFTDVSILGTGWRLWRQTSEGSERATMS